MELQTLLKEHRERQGMTQEQVATQLGLTRQAISKWERGEGVPDIENIIMLSDFYDISIDELLRGARFLPKPYNLGERPSHYKTFGIILLTMFMALLPSGGNPILYVIMLIIFGLIVVSIVKTGRVIFCRDRIVVKRYRHYMDSLLSIFNTNIGRRQYAYKDLESMAIRYKAHQRWSPVDFNPDTFEIVLVFTDGLVVNQDVTFKLAKDLPILCDFLSKKGVEIVDAQNIINVLISGKNLYEAMHVSS